MIFDRKIDEMEKELIESTQDILRIRSVKDEGSIGKPFGDGIDKALNYALDLGKKMGFKTKNLDGYAGYVEFGEGDELVGVLVHIDVVPEGENWTYPPYDSQIHDRKIYARGAIDNKGPGISAMYALKALKDSNVNLNKRIRIIFGTDEESGWEGIKYYIQNEESPDCSIVPDAVYPIINSEKGIITFKIEQKFNSNSNMNSGIKLIKGGNRANMVPDFCEAIMESEIDLKKELEGFIKKTGYKIEIEENKEDSYLLKSYGKSAHGSTPEKGINAIANLFEFVNSIEIEKDDIKGFIDFIDKYIGKETNGRSLGIDLNDDISGDLVLNLGTANVDTESGVIEINIRYPVKYNLEDIMLPIKKVIKKENILIKDVENKDPLYIPEDNYLIKKLVKVYEEVTGQKAELLSIGGGTYARSMKNAVAFGALFPGKPELAHQKDEYIEIDDLILNTKIYARALYELAAK